MPFAGMRYALAAIGVAALCQAALAGEPQKSTMSSIDLRKTQADAPKKSPSEGERDYWRCVLAHIQGTETTEAIQVVQAACRALASP